MNRKSVTLWLKAFRVTVIRDDRTHWKFVVFENVARHRFRLSSASGGSTPRKEEKLTLDRLDALNVLRGLKAMSREPEEARSYWPGDSLDDLVSEETARMWAMFDRAGKVQKTRQEQAKERFPKKTDAAPESPRPMLVPVNVPIPGGLSPEELNWDIDAQIRMMWEYAGGNTLRWKSRRRTPAGHKCDVLTFSGSDVVTPGPTSVEIPLESR